MAQALEGSLKRLGTDRVDLYWMHAWDELTPIEEVMRAFDDFVRAGKVLYIGISDAPAWWVARANTLAELRGWTQFVGLQIEYNLIERTPERELLPMAEALGLTVTPWSPLAGGWLTGKYAGKSKEEKRLDKTPQFARRTERNEGHRPDSGQGRESRRKISRAGRAQLAARAAQHDSDHRRAETVTVGGQFELRQMVVEREATRAIGRGQPD